MNRTARAAATLALLGTLSGAPAVALMCAQLCASAAHRETAGGDPMPCHKQPHPDQSMADPLEPDCVEHAGSGARAWLMETASRASSIDLAAVSAGVATARTEPLSPARRAPARGPTAAPPRPLSALPVLRI